MTAQKRNRHHIPEEITRVLIVEDEALIAMALEGSLRAIGLDVVGIADNQQAALEIFKDQQPNLVMMDISIRGDKDGIETAADLLRLDDVPVIFLTAYADDRTLERAAEVSPYGYVLKPYDERSLTATVTMALERHRADTALRIMQSTVDSAQLGVVLVRCGDDHHRSVSYVNQSFLELSGVRLEDVLGHPPCFLANDPESPAVLRLQKALHEGHRASEMVMGRRLEGDIFWSSVTISPIHNRSGQLSHIAVFHLDLTEARQTQDALAARQRLELAGQLTTGLAHDFNNILAVIRGFGEYAHRKANDEAVRESLEEVLAAVDRGTRLNRKLLDFSRHRPAQSNTRCDLGTVVVAMQPMIERLVDDVHQVHIRYAPRPTPVALDAVDVEQIVLNLVANARDAMPEGGEVEIEISLPVAPTKLFDGGQYVRLSVTDTGIGMDDQTVNQIFDVLFTTKPEGQGTGLGLATCRSMVDGAGGAIAVDTAIDQGTTFAIDFPLLDQAQQLSLCDSSPPKKVTDAACLLMFGDPATRCAFGRALTALGFTVHEVASAQQGWKALQDHGATLDIVVCDVDMTGDQGTEIIAAARAQIPNVPRVAVTHLQGSHLGSIDPDVHIIWKPVTASTMGRRTLDLIGRGHDHQKPVPSPPRFTTPATPADHFQRTNGSVPDDDQHPTTVLIIEDNKQLSEVWSSVVSVGGYQVVTVDHLGAARAKLAQQQFDLVVIDINLPDGNGLSLLEEIHQLDPLLPTVVVSGEPTVERVETALRQNASSFLSKPVAISDFLETTQRLVSEAQIQRLQHKLLMTRSSQGLALDDLPNAETDFHQSLQQLYVDFQPIVTPDGRVYGYEALMRSHGPYQTPERLLAVAELLGKIEQLGLKVRHTVATILSNHPSRMEPIFINLHPLEVRNGLLTGSHEPLLPWASRIVLEITERAQLGSTQQLVNTLDQLRAANFRVALDDLGQGYAGLSWLVKMIPDIAKIDISLIQDIHRSTLKQDTVAAVVTVCRRAGLTVIAEGVERREEALMAHDLGCDLLQGYYFGRPGPPFPEIDGP